MKVSPTSRGRLWATLTAVTGAMIANAPLLLGVGYLAMILPAVVIGRTFRSHCRFLAIIVLPVAAFALVVWPIFMGAPPGEAAGSNPAGGLCFAAVTVLRLMFIGGAVQACILSISAKDLAMTFRRWGLRGDWLIAALGATVLGPEMAKRADRVYTATLARGLLPSRSLWNRLKIIPAMLLPLTAWSLRSAISRADNWHERKLLQRIDKLAARSDSGSVAVSILIMACSAYWLLVAIAFRWRWL
jgi:hypothetical protein